jgi:hypothetical protein
MPKPEDNPKPKGITIEIDGETFKAEERTMTVAELLELVGLDADENYLVELHGKGGQENHEDAAEEIKLHQGMRFVTADRAPAEVA